MQIEMKTLESMENTTMSPPGKVNPLKNQMTLQQLQKMADKQRQQILRNNQELIQKQQRLMEMQSGMRRGSTASQASPKLNANDTYASKLRETYQNHLSRLRTLNTVQGEAESQKFNNVEIAHELEKVQEIFKEKQKELFIAAAKVDNLTKQLDGRRMGLSSARATPEKLNRRRKIRAARDQLDQLRKELSSRNEINNEQEARLELQKTSLQQKRKELQELDKKINLLGHQLHPPDNDSDASSSLELLNGDVNGNSKFGSKHLFDTLQKKKLGEVIGALEKSEGNHVPYTRRGNFYVAPDGREFDRPPTVEDYPQFTTGSLTNLPSLAVPTNIPVRSASSDSLPNFRGSSPHLPRSRTDVRPLPQVNTTAALLLNQENGTSPAAQSQFSHSAQKFSINSQSSSISSLSSITSLDTDSSKAPVQKRAEFEIWGETADFRTSSPILSPKMEAPQFRDSVLSKCADFCNGTAIRYLDSPKSNCADSLTFPKQVTSKQVASVPEEKSPQQAEETIKKAADEKPPPLPRKSSKPPDVPKKPAIAPKPPLPPKKAAETTNKASDQPLDSTVSNVKEKEGMTDEVSPNFPPAHVDANDSNHMSQSFADIDMIFETQNKLLPYLNNTGYEPAFEPPERPSEDETSSQAVESERALLPVVPPEKMPPTILKKPGRDNKKRGRIQLDPHALLLDAALEGEVKLVQEMVHRVPDPSFANAEGITALHNAVCGNHKGVVRLLVEIGCDINSPDNNGWTPLHCAAFYNDVDLCTFLVEHGASVFAMTYSDRQTAAEKCSRLEENYDQCFGYLHECKEQVGRINNCEVCSLFDYTAENDDELNFHCGEQLRILRRGDANEREWWWAENRKKETGYVPYNLLGIYPRIAGEV